MPPPYSPQANDVAERINRTLVEGLISLLNQAQAPKVLWAEALLACVFVRNWSPHAALAGGVPLSGVANLYGLTWVWSCRAYHNVTNRCAKLNDKAVPLIFIAYDGDTAACCLFCSVKDKFPSAPKKESALLSQET